MKRTGMAMGSSTRRNSTVSCGNAETTRSTTSARTTTRPTLVDARHNLLSFFPTAQACLAFKKHVFLKSRKHMFHFFRGLLSVVALGVKTLPPSLALRVFPSRLSVILNSIWTARARVVLLAA